MRTTVMEWRLTLEWEGDTTEAAEHKARRILDEIIGPQQQLVLSILGRSRIIGGLEGRAVCTSCGNIGTLPEHIEHETECVP